MALNAYLTLKGQKQGTIKGSVTLKGREGTIAVHAYNHSIISPRDAASGQATGRRQHGTLTITKSLDRSTPLLLNAMTANENLNTFQLRCFALMKSAAAGAGTEANHFTITLTNATVVGIRSIMESTLVPETAGLPQMEEVSFTYQKIEWVWVDGGITAQDDWEAAV